MLNFITILTENNDQYTWALTSMHSTRLSLPPQEHR